MEAGAHLRHRDPLAPRFRRFGPPNGIVSGDSAIQGITPRARCFAAWPPITFQRPSPQVENALRGVPEGRRRRISRASGSR